MIWLNMKISDSQWVQKSNSETCQVREYPEISDNMSLAKAKISGRYPDAWYVKNLECEQIYFVVSGSGTIYSSKWWNIQISKSDFYYFDKWESYYVVGNELEVLLVNTPSWDPWQVEYTKNHN